MSSTLEASVFMGKNHSENLHSIKNTGKDLTMKQTFDISEKLTAGQSDEIYGVNTINWGDSSWTHLPLIGDEEVVSLAHAEVHAFSDSVFCFGKMSENPQSNTVCEDKLTWFKSSLQDRALDTIDGEPMAFAWNISKRISATLELCSVKSKSSLSKSGRTRTIPRTDHLQVDVQRHLMGISRQSSRNANLSAQLRFYLCKEIFTRKMVIPRTWIRKEVVFYSWKQSTRRMGQSRWINDDLIFGESGHPVFRATSPLSRGTLRSQGGGKLSIHFCADEGTIETVFRTIISVNQLSISRSSLRFVWGIQSLPCKNGETCFGRTIWPIVCADKFVDENTCTFDRLILRKKIYCKSTKNELKRLSQQDIVWVNCVLMQDPWQRLMSDSISWRKTLKNFHNLQSQWLVVSTLCQETKVQSEPKGWIRGNTNIGPVLEVTTSYPTR